LQALEQKNHPLSAREVCNKISLSRMRRPRHQTSVIFDKDISAVLSVRPKIAELAFQVYGRTLHPELFEIFKTQTIRRGPYEATVSITSAGHLVTWRYQGLVLTEVAASAQHPLPQKRRLLSYRL
jgi:hypothetical protein